MTSRSRLSCRPLQVGGLLLATAALGTVTAPAASAMVDNTQPGTQTPLQAPVEQARVLTNSPASYLGTPASPVQFGTGKLQVSVAPEPSDDAADPGTDPTDEVDELVDAAPDMTGAVVLVTVTGTGEGTQAEDELTVGTTATCTTDSDGSCTFTGTDPDLLDGGDIALVPGMSFTVQQTGAPVSGAYALPPEGDDVVHGTVTALPRLFAPTVSPFLGRTALQFYDPARTAAGGSAGPVAGAPAPAAGPPAAAATDPSTAGAAGTGAAGAGTPGTGTATATPALATTSADVGPLAAVGGGLLVAGAAGLVLARRRTTR